MYPDRGSLGPQHSARSPLSRPLIRLRSGGRGGERGVVLPGLTGELEIPPARSRKRLASRHILELLTPV